MARVSESTKKWLGKTAQKYHQSLTPEVSAFLAGRGIDEEAQAEYQLGYVADPDPLHENYRGHLSIPFITPTGVVSMRFRCLQDHDCKQYRKNVDQYHAKYRGGSGEDPRLYNVQALHDAETVIGITEGELDAIIGTRAGLPSCGFPGANALKPHFIRLFQDFERVIILGDGDPAGRKFATTLAKEIPGGEAKVMPKDMDVTSFVVANGVDSFREYVGL